MEPQPAEGPRKKLAEAARWLIEGPGGLPPDDQELAALGLRWDGDEPDVNCYVWPENWPAVRVFEAMATQWSEGFRGKTGLRYESLKEVRIGLGIKKKAWREVFEGIRVMEAAALEAMRES